ncbi:hypothetical protein K505DRAFT_340267 [Melanomma pulvis-pyrius CBS 109.77]|uniref:DUF6536 domain-containing protein n=1 Tax=Melanomma pulvis-pyrius CBS 109.77 TaxID=1314802 RepID=A0A6A6X3D0_9PLEO|nr:hypothetical protein K505DRAFT_340267 [Melanomma pulvis-pyrius CBS 109.77]
MTSSDSSSVDLEQDKDGIDVKVACGYSVHRRIYKQASHAWGFWWTTTKTCFQNITQIVETWYQNRKLVIWFQKTFPGWETDVVIAIITAILVFNFNFIFLVVAARRQKPRLSGLGTLFEGDCVKVDWVNKISHGVINGMSTVLISQSNYCMQLLASPTRNDIDAAHKKREWVHIGIPSFQNVWKRHISLKRIVCWGVLAMSSIPLLLLWNSVVVFSPSAFQYNQLTVTNGFVLGQPFNDNALTILRNSNEGMVNPKVPDTNASTVITSEAGGIGPWPYQWLCPPDSRQNFDCYRQLFETDEDWNYPGYKDLKVEYCLSKPMKEHCKLEYGFIVAMFTVVVNSLKVICFVGTYWILKYRPNDIAKNQETFGMSTVEKEDFRNGIWDLRWVHVGPMSWRRRFPCAHFRAIGLRRWITDTSLLSAIPLIPAIFLLSKIHWLKHDLELNATTINQLGMGKPNTLFLFGAWSHIVEGSDPPQQTDWIIMGNVALANSPQLVISMAYYLWNSHLTVMFAAREYDLYAAPKQGNQGNARPPKKRSLRVTYPEEGTDQRCTSFLTIPFKYWAPTAALWTALHWLASQAYSKV